MSHLQHLLLDITSLLVDAYSIQVIKAVDRFLLHQAIDSGWMKLSRYSRNVCDVVYLTYYVERRTTIMPALWESCFSWHI